MVVRVLPHSPCPQRSPAVTTMDPKSQRPKRQDNTLSLLNAIIEVANLAKELSSPTPARAVFGTVGVILTMIKVPFSSSLVDHFRVSCDQDSMANKSDYVDLGLTCVDVCKALHQGMDGKELDDLRPPVREAIEKLTAWVTPAVRNFDRLLMIFMITELWRRSKTRSPRRVDGMYSPDLCTQRMIKRRLGRGSRTSLGSSKSSTYVQLVPLRSH